MPSQLESLKRHSIVVADTGDIDAVACTWEGIRAAEGIRRFDADARKLEQLVGPLARGARNAA